MTWVMRKEAKMSRKGAGVLVRLCGCPISAKARGASGGVALVQVGPWVTRLGVCSVHACTDAWECLRRGGEAGQPRRWWLRAVDWID